ncbi:MAG: DUF3305 domain-containing protein [Flavobacteriaceae bacterium]
MERILSIPVSVIVERSPAANPWLDWSWRPVSVMTGLADATAGTVLASEGDRTRFYGGAAEIELHRADAEALQINLSEALPRVWVVLEPDPGGPLPWKVVLAAAAAYHTETYQMGGGDAIVDTVPMPEDIAALVAAFVDAHYKPEAFVKRRRDRHPGEEARQFGKEPIFAQTGSHHEVDDD